MKRYTIVVLVLAIFGCNSTIAQVIENLEELKVDIPNNYVDFINYESKDLYSEITEKTDYKNVVDIVNEVNLEIYTANQSKIYIDSVEYFIVEGDLLLTKYEYVQYQLQKMLPVDTSKQGKLLGIVGYKNKIVKWPDDYIIKYSISKNTFQSEEKYKIVKNNLKQAIKDWENTCKVKFEHIEKYDENNLVKPYGTLDFVVIGFDTEAKFVAVAFYPYQPVEERRIIVDPTYFTTNYDKVGVFRHELGHVLGFRHEHIRVDDAPKGCPSESKNGTIPFTPVYDPKSVMHYFCGNRGTLKLEITELDKIGAQAIYGKPFKKL